MLVCAEPAFLCSSHTRAQGSLQTEPQHCGKEHVENLKGKKTEQLLNKNNQHRPTLRTGSLVSEPLEVPCTILPSVSQAERVPSRMLLRGQEPAFMEASNISRTQYETGLRPDYTTS